MKKTKTQSRRKITDGRAIDPSRILARDVMRTDVITLRADDTVESAVEMLEEYHVSGAPVVDGAGTLVGVLAVSDIARQEHVREGRLTAEHTGGPVDLVDEEVSGADLEDELFALEDYSTELLGRVRVEEWMTRGLTHVRPDATLAEVCRLMMSESIHRVFVVEEGDLRGVVSTYDVVRLLAGEPG